MEQGFYITAEQSGKGKGWLPRKANHNSDRSAVKLG